MLEQPLARSSTVASLSTKTRMSFSSILTTREILVAEMFKLLELFWQLSTFAIGTGGVVCTDTGISEALAVLFLSSFSTFGAAGKTYEKSIPFCNLTLQTFIAAKTEKC